MKKDKGLLYTILLFNLTFNITDTPVPGSVEHIAFNLVAENSVRLMLGAAFKLGFISLNVDYNIAKYNAVSAGLDFIF